MRTTLDLDDHILRELKQLQAKEGKCYRRREMARNRPSRKCTNRGVDKGCSLATGPRRGRDFKEMLKKMPGWTQHLHTGRLRTISERR